MPQAQKKEAQNKDLQRYLRHLATKFAFFYQEICRLIGLDPPGRARLDIAHFLQHGPKRRGVLAMRKIGKTPIACAYNLWLLFKNPNEQILHSSASALLARDSVLLERKWIEAVPFLRHLAPRSRSESKDRDTIARFDVGCADTTTHHSPSVTAVGMTGQLSGPGASHINPDDIETKENTLTSAARSLLKARAEEFEHLAFAGASILYIGTPHHEESIYRELEKMGYTFRAWPLVYPEVGEIVPNLAPMLQADLDTGRAKPGDPVFPEVFSSDACLERRASMSSAGWAMQCMMRTDLLETETYPLRLSDFMVFDIHRDKAPASITWGRTNSKGSTAREDIPSVGFGTDKFHSPVMIDETWSAYHGCKAFIDPAGRGEDETAWAIVAQLHGYLYVKCVDGVKGGATSENLEKIVLSLREHDARDLYIETNFGGDMLIHLIDPFIRKYTIKAGENDLFPNGWSCSVLGEHAVGQKEIRILEVLEPPLQQHRVVISPAVASDKVLTYQITRLTRKRNCLDSDDRIDALAGAVSQWKTYLNQDAVQITKRKAGERQKAILEKYRNRFVPTKSTLWGGWNF